MKYKAVLYDMDGTVLDTLQDLTEAVNTSLRRFGLPERSAAHVRAGLGNGAQQLIEYCMPDGADSALTQEVLSFYKPYYDAHCRIKTAPYPGMLALMQRLKEEGVKQAIVSNKPDKAVRELANAFFAKYLELSVGESETVRRKPCPDSVNTAAAAMGVSNAECVYVGDSEVDIETAKNAGMDCISVTWGFRNAEQLAPDASCMVDDMDALYAAIAGA